MEIQSPFQLDVVSVRLVRDSPIFSEQKITDPESAIAVVGALLCEMDREVVSKMAEVIGVSEAQLRFVTNTQSGMGLMKCGNVVIPFDNTIEKGTNLYNLYNTNIHERIAMEKSKKTVSTIFENVPK